jgi:hypothetical protein
MELDLLRYGLPYREISVLGEEELVDYWVIAMEQTQKEIEDAKRVPR